MSALLAIGWEPELRGTLTVIIAVAILMGSVFLILSTNMGTRLGFLVALTALAGWMFIMGGIWWAYGKGLQGPVPSWVGVGAETVAQNPAALRTIDLVDFQPGSTPEGTATNVEKALIEDGWDELEASLPGFQQAGAAASVLMEEDGQLELAQFQVLNVFDKGGDRYPKLGDSIDFLAFFHEPHYALVEIAPLVEQITEPGRAPARPVIDETAERRYVYMIRDMGHQRRPAALICIGSLIALLFLCYLLHRRDAIVAANRGQLALPSKANE
jgi:hypothetical protein